MKKILLLVSAILLVTSCSNVSSNTVASRDISSVTELSPNVVNDIKKELSSGRWENIMEGEEEPIFVFDNEFISLYDGKTLMGKQKYKILILREGHVRRIALSIDGILGEFAIQNASKFLMKTGLTGKVKSKYILVPNNLMMLGSIWGKK